MRELTISDVKELTENKKVKAHLVSAMLIDKMNAVVTAMPDSGEDGEITILFENEDLRMELEASKEIESIRGNESEIEIVFPNLMGCIHIYIDDEIGTEEDPVIDQEELCQYIKNRLDRLSKLTVDDIDLILNTEMEYLKDKGNVAVD